MSYYFTVLFVFILFLTFKNSHVLFLVLIILLGIYYYCTNVLLLKCSLVSFTDWSLLIVITVVDYNCYNDI